MAGTQYELRDPPTDGISKMCFVDNKMLLVSSWDATVTLHDSTVGTRKSTYQHKAAVLCCCASDPSHGYSGGLDKTVKMIDFDTSDVSVLGSHLEPVKTLSHCPTHNLIISGSWDKTVAAWDVRTSQKVRSWAVPERVYAMDVSESRLVVGTARRDVMIYDLRMTTDPPLEQDRESTLKYQTRAIACNPNGVGYAMSSVDGRVAVDYFDTSPQVQAQKYAFKCHRKSEQGVDTVFPVNDIAFHPQCGTFVTGGCDGVVNLWDPLHKKRLRCYPKYESSIAALCFNQDGTQLAIASSYTFEEGEKEHPADKIFIRQIGPNEAKPKPRAAKK